MDDIQAVLAPMSTGNNAVDVESIFALEQHLLEHEQLDLPVKHHYHGGMYIRELFIPKGTLLVGRVQKAPHFDVMLCGEMIVSSAEGVKHLAGFDIFRGPTGKKRAGYAIQDTHWLTVHLYDGPQDDDAMLDTISCSTYEQLEDVLDYEKLVSELTLSQDEITAQVENLSDQIDYIDETLVRVMPSELHGQGVFAVQDFLPGATLGYARVAGKRTQLGRYTNHAKVPNAYMQITDEDIRLVVSRPVREGEELTVNYRDVLAARTMGDTECQE